MPEGDDPERQGATPGPVRKPINIADLRLGSPDGMGDAVEDIYGFKPPEYAVYATAKRLLVQFADDPNLASNQRRGLSPLNPIRGEINGLIDGWRQGSSRGGLRHKASRYNRRVADALVVALEHDVDSAKAILEAIKQDILEERTSLARLQYLLAALACSLILVLVSAAFAGAADTSDLWRASAAGALGAFFSIAINIRTRTVLPDLRWVSNVTDACLRVVIGFIGASVLMALLEAKAVTLGLGGLSNMPSATTSPSWLLSLIAGFLAGFSERLVPDLLAKASVSPPSPSSAQPQAAAAAGKAAAAGAAAAGDGGGPDQSQSAQEVEDPAPHEAAMDHCLCGFALQGPEVTADDELPPATGGVAAAEGGQAK